jgi:hypothetical protein
VQKIISLFQRNYETDRLVRDEVVPGAEWVLEGEGAATRKWDGTCCLIRVRNSLLREKQLLKRYEVKKGKQPPADFEPAGPVDEVTGKQQGWRLVGDGPEDRWHREAWEHLKHECAMLRWEIREGTYELCGPKVQGNPEDLRDHELVRHGNENVDAPRTFEELREWFKTAGIEGVVWWHPDGRMVKIKAKDFGIKRSR